ncbi:hypothetical protein BDV12DRAFT_170958 [Aspergillus spectabilis]
MPSICPTSARISLPNVLRTLFSSEFATRSRVSRPLNRLFIPQRSLRNARTITTMPIDSIPITSLSPPSSQTPTHNESSATIDSSSAPYQELTNETSAESATNSARSSSSRQLKTKPKSSTEKSATDRDIKKTAKKSKKDDGPEQKKRESWGIQKEALKKKFPGGWSPTRKLSPDAIEGLRHLHSMAPDQFTTSVLAQEFKVSPEAIRRILKSKWRPSGTVLEDRRKRWERREERIWSHMSELGLRPHRKGAEPVSAAVNLLYNKNKRSKTPPAPPSDSPEE